MMILCVCVFQPTTGQFGVHEEDTAGRRSGQRADRRGRFLGETGGGLRALGQSHRFGRPERSGAAHSFLLRPFRAQGNHMANALLGSIRVPREALFLGRF